MSATKTAFDEKAFAEAADRAYAGLKETLEREHFGELIALAPESGEYVLAKTFQELERVRRERLSGQLVHIFRVGGGGAVRIGRGRHYGRLLGRE